METARYDTYMSNDKVRGGEKSVYRVQSWSEAIYSEEKQENRNFVFNFLYPPAGSWNSVDLQALKP